MVTSPFSSRVRRPILPPIGLQSVFREVRTEDELRQALTPTQVADARLPAIVANSGRRVVIAAPITLTSPIVIARDLIGLTIESHGYLPIYPGVDGIDAFDVRAEMVTIRGLFLLSTTSKSWARAFVLNANAEFCHIENNHVRGATRLVVDEGVGSTDYVNVVGNLITSDGGSGDTIACDSTGWRITSNIILSSEPVAVSVGANGGGCAIVGNECNGDITTSASSGSNTISANTNVGTVTAHGTDDALGGNT